MSDIFREVDEEVRQDRLVALWQQLGPYIIGAIVAIVLGVAGRAFWNDYVNKTKLAESEAFDAALALMESGDREAGMSALAALSASSSSGYGTLAQFEEAAALIANDQRAEAVAIYDVVAVDGNVSERLQDFAQLLGAMTAMDVETDENVRARLMPLAVREGAWYYSAQELLGLLDLRAENFSSAQAIFSGLMVDPDAPPGVKQRAVEILEVVESQMPSNIFEDMPASADTIVDENASSDEGANNDEEGQ